MKKFRVVMSKWENGELSRKHMWVDDLDKIEALLKSMISHEIKIFDELGQLIKKMGIEINESYA